MRQLTCMVMVLVTVAYISIGGVVFHLLESDNEKEIRTGAEGFFLEFLQNNTCISREELGEVLQKSLEVYRSGSLRALNQTEAQTNWDYYSSIFFAMTIVTTIGYGNISPATIAGRIFCVVFGILGIPLFLVTATAIGERLYWLVRKSQKRCFEPNEDGTRTKSAKICGGIFYTILGLGFFIFVPAGLFMLMEDWNYLESAYYSYISLTTIGFGDYVAGTTEENNYYGFRGIYRLAVAGWIFIGLSWMAGVITAMQELYSKPTLDRDPDSLSKSGTPRSSNADSRNQIKGGKNELMRVYSRDSGYSGHNGVTRQNGGLPDYNRQTSNDSAYNTTLPPRYDHDVEALGDPNGNVYHTKL